MTDVDPIVFEVLRHRLWEINDEQGRVGAQLSASPVVYETKDFNTALQTPTGDSLFIGMYTTRLSLCLDAVTKGILERFSDYPGFEDGDAFICNDPWSGAAHMNDILMVAPIFWEGQLMAWSGLAMHEVDVGGPNPGSFTVGAKDVFGEGPIISTVKLIEKGRIRPDIETWATRNSRTPEINRLDLRARWAAISRTRQRIQAVIAEYGPETFLAVQERILALTLAAFQRRLRGLPDGTWMEEAFLDHDGNTNELYRFCLRLTKSHDRLIFDFRGTSPQAPGPVNCTRVGLEGGTLSAILPSLCFDMPWSPAAIRPALEFISEPGTINNATHPAALSMATMAGIFATQHVAFAAIGKMLGCSDLRAESQANWTPNGQMLVINGRRADGTPFTGALMDHTGGSGGTAVKDGLDAGGAPGSPGFAIANVETYERLFPILYVYRRQAADTGGPGCNRGGAGMEMLVVPHEPNGAIDVTVVTHGASQPEARGLYGGYPASIQLRLILRDTEIAANLKRSIMPRSMEEVGSSPFRENGGLQIDSLAAKARTTMNPEDALVLVCCGGGGFGDPLRRDPAAVALDVRRGITSRAVAESLYGVCLTEDTQEVDLRATGEKREQIRAQRLAGGRNGNEWSSPGNLAAPAGPSVKIGDVLVATWTAQGWRYHCQRCQFDYGSVRYPKEKALWREIPMALLNRWNEFGLADEISVREYYCPSCVEMLSVEVRKKGDPMILDVQLAEMER